MTDDTAPLASNAAKFRQQTMSAQDFAAFGSHHFAYLKPVTTDGQPAIAIHAADGRQLAVVARRDAADVLVRQNDLEPVSVH